MGFDIEKSFIMAERLKQLREEKGLSHEKLSKALFDQYGVKISSDSLINYEVADARHTKAYKNQGMRVEYLRCLADFYGVPTDYVLGITDVKSTNITTQEIIRRTGLSENNVVMLCAARSAIDATGSNSDEKSDRELQAQFMEAFDFLTDICPRHVGFNFSLLVNDLISAALSDQGMLIDYGTLLDASMGASAFPDRFDPQMLMDQMANGMIPIPACEYVRYISNEIGKYIGDHLERKYGYSNDPKHADNDDTTI